MVSNCVRVGLGVRGASRCMLPVQRDVMCTVKPATAITMPNTVAWLTALWLPSPILNTAKMVLTEPSAASELTRLPRAARRVLVCFERQVAKLCSSIATRRCTVYLASDSTAVCCPWTLCATASGPATSHHM